ncbi:uncharacterized protein LY79DRAFT_507348 [Colletotrichum navitas]|uniref:Carboxylesterase family protein n=1 Tax=Colletotrichum navitas TaxID=681940 RepID=A0AAD8Q8E1_9PEZI|nr:uncharacterized protein LY79DRAFT_507348 [Colletotrichum navitas]KAK1597757.1 hypothetical protein LY79DRAFT_507348 [Colletotrichum navitas]
MGRLSRSKASAHGLGTFENMTISGPGHNAAGNAPSYNQFALLRDRDTNSGENTPNFIDSLTAKLKELHIYSPKKDRVDRSLLAPVCCRLNRLTIDTKIVSTLGNVKEGAQHSTRDSAVTESTQGPFPDWLPQRHKQDEGVPLSAETSTYQSALFGQAPNSFEASDPNFLTQVLCAANLDHHALGIKPGIESSIARHKAGQYDYVLSVLGPDGGAKRDNAPSGRGGLTLDFGCNVLVQTDCIREGVCGQSKPANAYKILATPFVTEDADQDAAQPSGETEDMAAVAEPSVRLTSPTRVGEEAAMNNSAPSGFAVSVAEDRHTQEPSLDQIENCKGRVASISTDEGSVPVNGAPRTPSRSTSTSSRSRIEDSVEAIDRLEEELEAVHIAARLATPTKSGRNRSRTDDGATAAVTAMNRTTSTLKRAHSTGAELKPVLLARTAQRKSVSATDNDAAKASPGKSPTRRSTVARPTSLLPPKPPVKSTKAPTKPSFELPGEAVARRIKEQREARLAQQAAKAAPPAPQRSRSLKVPTRPNFELPGEAISQRKRAEREARLKAQEEEERKRREFKARPIKANLGSAVPPRETVTSRARQNKGSEADECRFEESQSKRRSMVGTPHTLARTSSTRSPQTRGRGMSLTAMTDQASRATSTSTSSMSGKRSTLSAEDLEHQRHIGKEIFQRDNCYIKDKERERREREWNAKMAREQAAERSRQAGREWAEKQRRKQLAATAATASQAA